MPCWVKLYVHIAEFDLFAIRNRLSGTGEIFAIAQPHHVEGFLRGQNGTMTGAGMIGMPMRDNRAINRAHGIDMKAAGLAMKAGSNWLEDVLRAHVRYIVGIARHSSPVRDLAEMQLRLWPWLYFCRPGT